MTSRNIFICTILYIFFPLHSLAQNTIVKDFEPVCDSLSTLILERCDIKGELKLKAVMRRGSSLDFYFTESLGDFPWQQDDAQWFRRELKNLFPDCYKKYKVGEIYSRRVDLKKLITPELTFSGNPAETRYKAKKSPSQKIMVKESDGYSFNEGLEGRTIALWQSHGRYYDSGTDMWRWQRPPLFQTCEDMFTQAFVLPFLIPMLENAGAYVMTPRERDVQRHEIIADNDPVYQGEGARISGEYEETGRWEDAGVGFADTKAYYYDTENPFTLGSSRKASCISSGNSRKSATAIWRADVPERGEYAVYISYCSLKESSEAVKYTVFHMGGKSEFVVNQKMGGGTWVYLGTFEFGPGEDNKVVLDSRMPKGYKFVPGSIVTADAVKFGGGMGNIARGASENREEWQVSGLPRYAEGARYWLQWAGADSTVFHLNEGKSDYKDDFMCRGDWVAWMHKTTPIDLSLGFHTDAGVTPNDSIVGTLAIYTLKSEGKQKLPSGDDRMTSREFADIVQSQIVNDLKTQYDSLWQRRCIWDRGYRESRTPSCPSMLLELLSHQNFADMKYGLDPSFRFSASRAVYKGIVKYLSNRYQKYYTIQPLPVNSISVKFKKSNGTEDAHKAVISWKETEDTLEPTAVADGFILYTRIDDGGFDTGRKITAAARKGDGYQLEVDIKKGHIYSFRIAAYNKGGKSFESETVSIGVPLENKKDGTVLIVNNFDRVSGPTFYDTPSYASFNNRLDGGVPYIRDISFIGEMYENRRAMPWLSDNNPGFGASYNDKATGIIAGNTFDFAVVHGKAVLRAGYAFSSCSNDAFCGDTTLTEGTFCVDMICGKQVSTVTGTGKEKFRVFTPSIQKALTRYTSKGGNVLISGANIGTDVWDTVFPIEVDSTLRANSIKFAKKVLGYKWGGNSVSRRGAVKAISDSLFCSSSISPMEFYTEPNEVRYCVEAPDGIQPADKNGKVIFRYADTGVPAGTIYCAPGYKTVCLGFPVEALKNDDSIFRIIDSSLKFFKKE